MKVLRQTVFGSATGFKEKFRIHKSTGKIRLPVRVPVKYWQAQLFTLTHGLNNMNECYALNNMNECYEVIGNSSYR